MDGVDSACVEKYPLSQSGFTRIDVSRDSDVSHPFHRKHTAAKEQTVYYARLRVLSTIKYTTQVANFFLDQNPIGSALFYGGR